MNELDAMLAGINAAVHELAGEGGLIDTLTELLAERSQAPEEVTGRRPPGSRPPWDPQAANVYMEIHASARRLENDLHTYVHGRWRYRHGGSTATTKEALGQVVILAEHERVPEAEVRHVARVLGRLVRSAQSLPGIDTAPAPAATLRQPCPYCREGALESAVDGSTEIRCANEVCVHPATGERTRWTRSQWPALWAMLQDSA